MIVMLPEIDIKEVYKEFWIEDKFFCRARLPADELLDSLKKEKNPRMFKSHYLGILQLVTQGLAYKRSKTRFQRSEGYKKASEALEIIVSTGIEMIGTFYSGEGIDYEHVKRCISAHEGTILEICPKEPAQDMFLDGREDQTYAFGCSLQNRFQEDGKPGLIVGIAYSGIEPALLAAYCSGLKDMLILRYSFNTLREIFIRRLNTKEEIRSKVKGKKILVVDDTTHTGKTFKKVCKYLLGLKPERLKKAAVCKIYN